MAAVSFRLPRNSRGYSRSIARSGDYVVNRASDSAVARKGHWVLGLQSCKHWAGCINDVSCPVHNMPCVAIRIATPDLLHVSMQSRLYHQPFWLFRASSRLALLPLGIVVEPSPRGAWLLIALALRLQVFQQFTEFIQDGFLRQATELIVDVCPLCCDPARYAGPSHAFT